MRKAVDSIRVLATEHATPRNLRIAFVLLTLVTLVLSAGAPGGPGGGNGFDFGR